LGASLEVLIGLAHVLEIVADTAPSILHLFKLGPSFLDVERNFEVTKLLRNFTDLIFDVVSLVCFLLEVGHVVLELLELVWKC